MRYAYSAMLSMLFRYESVYARHDASERRRCWRYAPCAQERYQLPREALMS